LCASVQRGDQGPELRFLNVLQFVDEYDDGTLGIPRGNSHLLKQSRQIDLQIAVVRQAGLRFIVKSNLNVFV
jgi:hypothetical protein